MPDDTQDLTYQMPDAATVVARLRAFNGSRHIRNLGALYGIKDLDSLYHGVAERLGGQRVQCEPVILAFAMALNHYFCTTHASLTVQTAMNAAAKPMMRCLIPDNAPLLEQILTNWGFLDRPWRSTALSTPGTSGPATPQT